MPALIYGGQRLQVTHETGQAVRDEMAEVASNGGSITYVDLAAEGIALMLGAGITVAVIDDEGPNSQ